MADETTTTLDEAAPSTEELRAQLTLLRARDADYAHRAAEAARERARHHWAETRERALRDVNRFAVQTAQAAADRRTPPSADLAELLALVGPVFDRAVRQAIEDLPDQQLVGIPPHLLPNARAVGEISGEIARRESEERRLARLHRNDVAAESRAEIGLPPAA